MKHARPKGKKLDAYVTLLELYVTDHEKINSALAQVADNHRSEFGQFAMLEIAGWYQIHRSRHEALRREAAALHGYRTPTLN